MKNGRKTDRNESFKPFNMVKHNRFCMVKKSPSGAAKKVEKWKLEQHALKKLH